MLHQSRTLKKLQLLFFFSKVKLSCTHTEQWKLNFHYFFNLSTEQYFHREVTDNNYSETTVHHSRRLYSKLFFYVSWWRQQTVSKRWVPIAIFKCELNSRNNEYSLSTKKIKMYDSKLWTLVLVLKEERFTKLAIKRFTLFLLFLLLLFFFFFEGPKLYLILLLSHNP